MTSYDFSPLFRSTIGFERLARLLDATLESNGTGNGYPPYNIAAVGEDHYRLSMAVAGFAPEDMNIEVQDHTLTISGRCKKQEDGAHFLHHGIAERDFTRKFQLADHVVVTDAHMENGLLTIDLVRELPEEKKPRTITIERGAPKSLVNKAKALLNGNAKSKAA